VGTTSVRTLESLYYIGVKLASNPDASEAELHIDQWMPYEYASATRPVGSSDDGRPEALTVEQALHNILNYLDINHLKALHTSTQIIIAPGYDYKIVKMMVTNFHMPQSTLLLLVSAFVHGDWRKIYRYALDNEFRFLSYGDSSLLIP
jgi:S-adenosylmethionine:tRNA ribosyltransferase-isomerase